MNILRKLLVLVCTVASTSVCFPQVAETDSPGSKRLAYCREGHSDSAVPAIPDRSAEIRRPVSANLALSLAKNAADKDDLDLAASFGRDAYCKAVEDNAPVGFRVLAAAYEISAALDVEKIGLAAAISDDERQWALGLPDSDPSRLQFEMAYARLLSFRGALTNALAARESLQPRLIATFGAKSEESRDNSIRLESLRAETGDAEEALKVLLKLKGELELETTANWRLRNLAFRAVASALSVVGRENEALAVMRAVRDETAAKFGEDDAQLLKADERICEILTRMNRAGDALEIASKIFLSYDRRLAPESAQKIRAMWRLALLYAENSRTDSAKAILDFVRKVVELRKDQFDLDFYFQILSVSATLDSIQGRYRQAREKWDTVYTGLLANHGPNSVDTQVEATNLAIAMQRVGEFKEGCQLLDETRRRIEQSRPNDTWDLEFARIASYECAVEQTGNSNAELLLGELERSWNAISTHFEPTNFDALTALGSYARASLRVGDATRAKRLLVQFVRYAEEARESEPKGSMSRMDAFSAWVTSNSSAVSPIAGYRQLALLHAQDAELESALRISELARDRTLGDLFADAEWRRTRLPAGERGRLDAVIDRIQDFDERLAVSGDIVDRVRLEAERTLAVAERGRVERELRDRLHLDEAAPRPPTLDDLRERLPAGTALVSVLHSGETWWALVIARGLPARFVPLADPDLGVAASAWVRRLRGEPVRAWPLAGDRLSISDVRPGGATGAYLSEAALGQRLAQGLFLPLARAAAPARRLVFVGDDELVGVPLQALPDGAGLVLDRFAISYAPSLSTYARWLAPARQRTYARDLLAVGAVDDPPFAAPETDDPIVAGVQFAADHPLPFAREEIDGIVALFDGRRATAWTGKDANKTALRQASRSGALLDYRFVHFATHAWAQADQPESSAIVLAGAGGDLPTQRALTAAELAGLHMGSDLIVLSACDTGVGPFQHGRGLLGLAYAGLAAGNRAELVSLWPVADDTTARFMQDLYRRLRTGTEPVQAVAAAQRALRRSADPRRSDPRAWAPFVLYGAY